MLKLIFPTNRLYGATRTICADPAECVNCAIKEVLRNLDILDEAHRYDQNSSNPDISGKSDARNFAVDLENVLRSDELDIRVISDELGIRVMSRLRVEPSFEGKRAILDIHEVLHKLLKSDLSTKDAFTVITDVLDILDKRDFADEAVKLYKLAFTSQNPDLYQVGTPVYNATVFVLKQAIAFGWPGLDNSDIKHILDMWHECAGTITYCTNWYIRSKGL